jgi:hypothetical protein
VQRTRRIRVHRVERIDHLFLLDPGGRGQLRDRGRAAELGRQLVERAREAEAQLFQASWDVHGPRLVPEVAPDLADDRRDGVACEVDAAVHVEAIDGLDEADGPDLYEVLERLAAPCVARGERAHERHQLDERPLTSVLVTVAVKGDEEGIDVRIHDRAHLRVSHGV